MRMVILAVCLLVAVPVVCDARSLQPVGSGDVNGDGRPDIVVADSSATVNGKEIAGLVSVVFGGRNLRSVHRDALGANGFRVLGAAAGDSLGGASIVGDVNGDRCDDLLVVGGGSVQVVFGCARESGDVDLARPLGARGITIVSALAGGYGLTTGAGIGDMDGDGLNDIVVGAPAAGFDYPKLSWFAGDDIGTAWVVRGQRAAARIDVAEPGAAYMRVDGWGPEGLANELAGPGDVNGDHVPDLLIDGYQAVVVFGSRTGGVLKAGYLNARGFLIGGLDEYDKHSVGAPGDVNRDGRADLLVGDRHTRSNAREPGLMYLVHGKGSSEPVNVDHIGERGLALGSRNRYGSFGTSVQGIGDFNGDGRPDLCSASGMDDGDTSIELDAQRTGVHRLSGLRVLPTRYDYPDTCRATGDVNGDGRDDVVLSGGRGRAWLILGNRTARGSVRLAHLGGLGFELRH